MDWILICKLCKFGKYICYNFRDIKFFLGGYFFGAPCTFMTYLWPSHTQPRPHYVLKKLSGRRKNLYIVVGMQCKPTRTWYGLHECGGRGRTLDSAVFMVFVWAWRGYYLLLILLLYSVLLLLLTSQWRRSYHRHHLHQSRAHQAPPTHRHTWSLTWHTSSQVNTCISQLHVLSGWLDANYNSMMVKWETSWLSGSALVLINVVARCWAWLILGWMTICRWVNYLSM